METYQKLIEEIAGLAARRGDNELLMLFRRRLRKIHEQDPDLHSRLNHVISSAGGVGAARRFDSLGAVPKDSDTGMDLITRLDDLGVVEGPVLPEQVKSLILRFIKERKFANKLKNAGVAPPSSLALMGKPGTGKTTLAKWIASELDLPFLSLNIASVVTSYLGQTGQNLKKALDRAKLEPCVLLLDEFDALGYQRTNDTDVGEMKRVVTVLLQEIEEWPEQSVVIAATNLPDRIDSAFQRRFSRWIELPLPGPVERLLILQKYYGDSKYQHLFKLASVALDGASGADLLSFTKKVKSLEILDDMPSKDAILSVLFDELSASNLSDDVVVEFISTARDVSPKIFTYRKLGEIFKMSHTRVAIIVKNHTRGDGNA